MSYKGNVLVIDDTPANLRLLVRLLTDKGYKVRALPNGKLALKGIKQSLPDLILLDIMMPEMSGYEVCEQLKADETTRDIPVIFISAINEVLDKVKAFSVGGVDYITKPFQVEEVIARVETHLENRFLHQSLQQKNDELAQTLEQLQATQSQLIQSEKMAALGQLIASIAHEVNTPLGAIKSSANNVKYALKELFTDFHLLFHNLSPEQQTHFLSLLEQSLANSSIQATSKEKRQFKRDINDQLEKQNIENARQIADTLIDLNIYHDIQPFLPLLKSRDRDWILQLAYNLIRLQSNNNNMMMAVERAAKIVFALKSYARYDQSGQKHQIQITEGLETVLELYYNQIKQGIEVIRDYQPLPSLWCYPDELNQVWTNLIHNAIYAMQGKGQLKISVSERDHYGVVTITDSGCGIPSEIQTKIFEPFFTTKPSGEGSGLGLDISRQIIEKHEGKIEVMSQPGQTTFEVWLPISLPPSPQSEYN